MDSKTQSTDRARLPYQQPVLEDLGSLRELTAGGDGSSGNYDGSGYSASSSGGS